MLSDALAERLRPHLPGPLEQFEPVGGGCIADGGRLQVEGGPSFFLKRGEAAVARTFPGEAAGLEALRRGAQATGGSLRVPEMQAVAEPEDDAPGFLLMEWIEPDGRSDRAFWETFGAGMAALHQHTAEGERYGFDCDNFIGRLPQANDWAKAWPAFFRDKRLRPQVRRARGSGRWRSRWDAPFDALLKRLPHLLPERPPASVLHGDLWGGNFLTTRAGAALIDPAAYYGHREADLAMTELFGGFRAPFYEAYRQAWPLEEGYEQRRDVYNLYHLVNHLNHFGAAYARQVERVVQQFR
jgi:fructosamine-3-kinase